MFSTFLTLIVIPVVYSLLARFTSVTKLSVDEQAKELPDDKNIPEGGLIPEKGLAK